jgi:hypothetical protein
MPSKSKHTKNNTKPPAVEPDIVTGDKGPQLSDTQDGPATWANGSPLTMQKTGDDVKNVQSQSGDQDTPSAEQPEKEENGLTTPSGGYFQRKLSDFQEKMVDAQARWANSLEEMERIMEEDCQDAEKVTTILRKRQNNRRKEWKRALDIDL